MKKTLLTLMLSVCAMCLQGQDTLVPRDTNLFYNWWYEDYVAADSDVFLKCDPFHYLDVYSGLAGLHEVALRFETDSPIDILGISFPAGSYHDRFGLSPDGTTMYINLYAAEDTGIRLVGQFDRLNDPVSPIYDKPCDFFGYTSQTYREEDCAWSHKLASFACREYYFDTPVRVEDSFYISYTGVRSITTQVMRGINPFIRGGDYTCDHLFPNTFPFFKYKYRLRVSTAPDVHDTLPWENTEARIMLLAFPIIRYGSPYANCIPVNGITYKEESSGQFLFTWNDTIPSHRGWEFTYVPEGTSPDAGTIMACDSATALAVVEANRHYRAYVRPRCVGNRYGDWGDGIPFWHGSTPPDPTDILPAASDPAFFTLTPNPTDGKVVVEVACSQGSGTSGPAGVITVRDAAGHEVLRQKVSTPTTLLDLSPLPAGTYFVTVTLGEQSGTRKLVVK